MSSPKFTSLAQYPHLLFRNAQEVYHTLQKINWKLKMSQASPAYFDRLNQHKLYNTSWKNKKRTTIKSTASSSQGQSLNLQLTASITFRAHHRLKHFISPWKKILLLRLKRGPWSSTTTGWYCQYSNLALIHIPIVKTLKMHTFNIYKGVLKVSKTCLF